MGCGVGLEVGIIVGYGVGLEFGPQADNNKQMSPKLSSDSIT